MCVCAQDDWRSPAVHVVSRASGPEEAVLRHSDSAGGGRGAEEQTDQDLQVTTT